MSGARPAPSIGGDPVDTGDERGGSSATTKRQLDVARLMARGPTNAELGLG